jgi:hypothetical protein
MNVPEASSSGLLAAEIPTQAKIDGNSVRSRRRLAQCEFFSAPDWNELRTAILVLSTIRKVGRLSGSESPKDEDSELEVKNLVRPERFELPTCCSGGNRSIQLSYGRRPLFRTLYATFSTFILGSQWSFRVQLVGPQQLLHSHSRLYA